MGYWRLLSCLAVVAACGCFAPHQTGCKLNDEKTIYYVVYDISPYRSGQILVNGVPAVSRREGDPYYTGYVAINWYLKDGVNDVCITAEKPTGENDFSIQIFATAKGRKFDEGTLLYQFLPKKIGEVVDEHASITAHIPRKWAWQSADEIGMLSAGDRQAILGIIEKMQAAYAHRDLAEIESFADNHREATEASYGDYDADRNWWHDYARRVFDGPDFSITPFATDDIVLTPYGRLVLAENAKSQSLINARSGSKTDPEHPRIGVGPDRLMFMKHDGTWSITGYGG